MLSVVGLNKFAIYRRIRGNRLTWRKQYYKKAVHSQSLILNLIGIPTN